MSRPSGPRSRFRSSGSNPKRSPIVRQCLFEAHESQSDRLHFGVGQRLRLHSPNGLPFEKLAQEFHERQHQLRHRALNVFRIGIPARGAGGRQAPLELGAQRVDVAGRKRADIESRRGHESPARRSRRGAFPAAFLARLRARARDAVFFIAAREQTRRAARVRSTPHDSGARRHAAEEAGGTSVTAPRGIR